MRTRPGPTPGVGGRRRGVASRTASGAGLTIDAGAAARGRSPAAPWRFGLLAAAGAVGTSSVVPALPLVAADLGLGEAATAAVVSAYAVPYAASTIIAGQVCDARGPRVVLRVSLVLAVVGAVLAGLGSTGTLLLLGRALQGLGAGAVTMAAYDVNRRRDGGIAATAALLTLGASSGPFVGGVLAQLLGWQAAVVLPGVLHLTGVAGLRTPTDGGGGRGTDGAGLAATAVGAATGAAALQLARVAALPALVLAVVAAPLLTFAVRRTLAGRGRVPPAALLRVAPLRRRGALAASIAATYFASLVLLPVALGRAGYGTVAIGALLVPGAVSGALSARWSDATGERLRHWTDPAAAAVTLGVLGTMLLAPPVVGVLALVGLAGAYGTVQPRLLSAVAGRVEDGPATAIGAANLVLLLGGGVGAAAVGGLGRAAGGAVLAVLVTMVTASAVRHARDVPA